MGSCVPFSLGHPWLICLPWASSALFTNFVFPWAFYWLHWAFPAQLLHTHPWGSWACHQSPTLFACIALGLPRPILTFFHITYCPWVCYSLFLSFWALLSPFSLSRSIYLFHGPVIHYSYRLGLMVFFCSPPLANFFVLQSWASFLTFGFHKKRPSTPVSSYSGYPSQLTEQAVEKSIEI